MSHHQDNNVNEIQPHRSDGRRSPARQPGTGDVVAFPHRPGAANHSPRCDGSPFDDSPEQGPWRHVQRVRGGERHCAGYVTYVGGEEGERRRAELAAVLSELLRWAASPQDPKESRDHEQRRAA